MNSRSYLPSPQFTLIAISVALSAGLVVAAEFFTQSPQPQAQIAVDNSQAASDNSNWQAALYAIEAENASTSLAVPSPDALDQLLQAAQSPNLTDTIGRTLLINISNAESQSLGDDIPTQDQIVAEAAAQAENAVATTTVYGFSDLNIVPTSSDTLHAYGNAVIQTLSGYPNASEQATFLGLDEIVEGHETAASKGLAGIGAAYKAAAVALLAVPVPQTLAPLHLEVINNLLSTSATYADMETIGSDPVRGLEGFQTYESLMDNGANLFTNIAQELSSDGILFTKDEPGSAWSVFLNPTGTPTSPQ